MCSVRVLRSTVLHGVTLRVLRLAFIQFNSIQFNSIQFNSIQFNSIQFNSIQFNSIQFNSIQFNSIQFNSIQFNSIQFNSIQFNSIQFNSIQFNSIQFNSIQFNSIQFNSIQFIHFTCRHKATAPQGTHVRVTVYLSFYAACAIVWVCMWSVGTLFAQREMTRPSASSGAHRPRPSPREIPPRSLVLTPHAPALVPPVVDHPRARAGFTGIPERCAAQQDRPIPSVPERERKVCEVRKTVEDLTPPHQDKREKGSPIFAEKNMQSSAITSKFQHCRNR